MQALADQREAYAFTHHVTGPNREATPDQLLPRLKALNGINGCEAFDRSDLQKASKWHCQFARQNGMPVLPTFRVNGLIQPAIGSGDEIRR